MKFACPNSECDNGVGFFDSKCSKCGFELSLGGLRRHYFRRLGDSLRRRAMTKCPYPLCGAIIPISSKECPECKQPLTHPQALLLQLRGYYGTNPAREVKDINGIACTAAACQAVSDVIVAAQKASNQSNMDAGDAQAALQDGIAAGRARASGLLAELGQLLDDNDPRWLAFGFDLPGHPSSPDVPQNLVVTPGVAGSQTLFVHCDDARRANGYRFTVTNVADGTELAELLTQDAEATFDSLPAGAKVNVVVTARNVTGESQPSATVAAVVP